MDTNKLTIKSRDAVSAALRNALTAGNPYAEPSHLLHALLMVPGNTVAPLIAAAGADPAVVDAAAQGAIAKLPSAKGSSVSQPQLSGSFARVLADAETRAEQLGDAYVATEHLLISLATVDSDARKILTDLRIKPQRADPGVQRRPRQQAGDQPPKPRPRRRRWISTASTSPPRPAKASSTRSSAGTPRSAGWSRCWPAGPRTTRC